MIFLLKFFAVTKLVLCPVSFRLTHPANYAPFGHHWCVGRTLQNKIDKALLVIPCKKVGLILEIAYLIKTRSSHQACLFYLDLLLSIFSSFSKFFRKKI